MRKVIKGYKGFNKNMTCNGFQYEEGKTYTTEKAQCCNAGFHFCENPLDVLSYYDLFESVFHEVEGLGKFDKNSNDSKVATTKIRIGIKLDLKAYIKASIDFCFKICKSKRKSLSGDSSKQASSGDSSKQASSGDYSTQASSGYYSKQASSGYSSKQASSGDSSKQASSGDSSKQASSGDYSKQELNGKDSVAVSAGRNCRAKGKIGCWICLSEWKQRKDHSWYPYHVEAIQIDGKEIKEDVWYELKDKKFIEVKL